MQNLRTSANKGSNDAYDVSVSLTWREAARMGSLPCERGCLGRGGQGKSKVEAERRCGIQAVQERSTARRRGIRRRVG